MIDNSNNDAKKITYVEAAKEVITEDVNKYGVAIISGLKKMFVDNEYVNPVVLFGNEINKRKIQIFLENITDKETLEFINTLPKDEDRIYLAENIRKTINLNDDFQIYILSCLFNEFKENHQLNYFEKKLYYTIDTLSEDDFKIYWSILKKYMIEKESHDRKLKADEFFSMFNNEYPNMININNERYVNLEIIKISLNRFVDMGILTLVSRTEQENTPITYEDKIPLKQIEYYTLTSYSIKLFDYLDKICMEKEINFKEILAVEKNRINNSNW